MSGPPSGTFQEPLPDDARRSTFSIFLRLVTNCGSRVSKVGDRPVCYPPLAHKVWSFAILGMPSLDWLVPMAEDFGGIPTEVVVSDKEGFDCTLNG